MKRAIFLVFFLSSLSVAATPAFQDSTNVFPSDGKTPARSVHIITKPPTITNEQYSSIAACPAIDCSSNNPSTCPDYCSVTRTMSPNDTNPVVNAGSVDAVCPAGYAAVNVNNARNEYLWQAAQTVIPVHISDLRNYLNTPNVICTASSTQYTDNSEFTCHKGWFGNQGFPGSAGQPIDMSALNYSEDSDFMVNQAGATPTPGNVNPSFPPLAANGYPGVLLIGQVSHASFPYCCGGSCHNYDYDYNFYTVSCALPAALVVINDANGNPIKSPDSMVCARIIGKICRANDPSCQ